MFCWSFSVYHSFLPFQSYVVKERYWVKTVLLQQHILLYCKTNKCIFSSVRGRENILILEASVALGLHLIAVQLNFSASRRCRCIYFKLHVDYDEEKGTSLWGKASSIHHLCFGLWSCRRYFGGFGLIFALVIYCWKRGRKSLQSVDDLRLGSSAEA